MIFKALLTRAVAFWAAPRDRAETPANHGRADVESPPVLRREFAP